MKSEIEVIDSNLDTSKESVIEMTSDTTFNIINHTADNAIIDDSIGSDHVGSHVKLYDDEKYMNKLNVYAQKLGMSLDEIKSKRMSKNQLKKLVRNKVSKRNEKIIEQ